MTEIHVRNLRFAFDEAVSLDIADEDLPVALSTFGISLTLPYLEPYLIRTMKVAIPRLTQPGLAEDARAFSQQEGHHYRNHVRYNERIREAFGEAAPALSAIEQRLEADYQRFTREESLDFNVGYAEGFEAMTCALALASAEYPESMATAGGELFAWHLAEEIEHRSVAFEVFEDLVGSYWARLRIGTWAQGHYLRAISAFVRVMTEAMGRKVQLQWRPLERCFVRNYLRTFSPRYDPRQLRVPPKVGELLEGFDARLIEQARP